MDSTPHCHLVGVGGIGMSALAQVLMARGVRVTGSDRLWDQGQTTDILDRLMSGGVELVAQDGSAVTPRTQCVALSSAIESDNPDRVAAATLSIPVRHRSDMLAECLRGATVIAVSGTSGKSTVTAMIGWVLQALGEDPTVVNGAVVPAWRTDRCVGNVRIGRSDLWVIEADESDRTLNAYDVDWAVVTNVSTDHFSVEEACALFRVFVEKARQGAVSAVDEPDLLAACVSKPVGAGRTFCYADLPFHVPMPGQHNAQNAWLVVVLMERMGYTLDKVAGALANFPGLHRRLERVGEGNGIRIFDDYAHNPAKIEAAWKAVRNDAGRVLAIWRPHGYGPLRQMMEPLIATFARLLADGDMLTVLPVYDAGGTADRSVTSEVLVERLQAQGVRAVVTTVPEEAVRCAVQQAQAQDTVLVMGARDPGLPALAREILLAIRSAH